MKAVTIQQPFAAQLAAGHQWIFSSEWSTSHRGPLAIHAAAKSDLLNLFALRRHITSALLGVGDLVACVSRQSLLDSYTRNGRVLATDFRVADVLASRFADGPWLWLFRDLVPMPTPILNVRGSVGIWTLIPSQVAAMAPAIVRHAELAAKRPTPRPMPDIIEPDIDGPDDDTYCIQAIDNGVDRELEDHSNEDRYQC